MKLLRKVALSLALIYGPAACPGLAQGSTDGVCVLRLKVVDHRGLAIDAIPIELIDSRGFLVRTTITRDGDAEICDSDFGVYSVRAGGKGCLPTTVTGVRFKPSEPLRLTVVVNGCESYKSSRSSCEAYLRVVTPKGTPIGDSEAWAAKSSWKIAGDRFGRIVFPVGRGATTKVSVGATGYKPQDISLMCRDVEEIEERVVLERQE